MVTTRRLEGGLPVRSGLSVGHDLEVGKNRGYTTTAETFIVLGQTPGDTCLGGIRIHDKGEIRKSVSGLEQGHM